MRRRLPVGAEVQTDGAVHFRVWAPKRRRVEVVLEGDGADTDTRSVELDPDEEEGFFSGRVAHARAGMRYRYRLDRGDAFPDPASRSQPAGPHGPSAVVDPGAFGWTDGGWPGLSIAGQVVYEMHVGTFTPEGTWAAAARELAALADLGITCIEMMPVAEWAGDFGWGYDGVDLYAPYHGYGAPDDLRAFVDRAHALGIGVILDVVYNHLGPDGNYLKQFSDLYFSEKHKTDWGDGINFDGPGCEPVREFFVRNATYWIEEFHFDGLRLDATQNIYDDGPRHILAELVAAARAAAGERSIIVIGENEPQHTRLVRRPEAGGYGLDALWNDDYHHSAMLALTGKDEAYYNDYAGSPQELLSAVKWGYLFQGQWYRWQGNRRGTPALDLGPTAFVNFIENHDQVANTAFGLRAHQMASPSRWRAMTALTLLAPQTPMLFQGEEFASSKPFLYFSDWRHNPELAEMVKKGRCDFLAQFPSIELEEIQTLLDDPSAPETFEKCKLDLGERERNARAWAMHRDLLALRREDPVFRLQRRRGVDGAVLADRALALRFFADDGDDRLLVVNLGRALRFDPAPEPLLAPPPGRKWALRWTSDDPRYGGSGTAPVEAGRRMQGERLWEEAQRRARGEDGRVGSLKPEDVWHVPGECAVVLG